MQLAIFASSMHRYRAVVILLFTICAVVCLRLCTLLPTTAQQYCSRRAACCKEHLQGRLVSYKTNRLLATFHCCNRWNSVHTGASHNIEVPIGRWINMYNLYQLPTGVELWTNFELQCGRAGILDLDSTVAIISQNSPIRSKQFAQLLHAVTNSCTRCAFA
jgi:hypothetical protein